jgi:hypothetical protein
MRNSASFQTTITGSGNKAGIIIPPEVIEQLGGGKRPAVVIDLNGYSYRSTVAVMGGAYMVGVSAAVRADSGLNAGDDVKVTLTLATEPRAVDVPSDFATAMAEEPATRAFFDSLANSLQRYHVDNINTAKTADTRTRRIVKTVELFRAGKKR